MAQLHWTPYALKDLDRLHAFLESKDPAAARHAIQTIRRSINVLKTFPEIGRPFMEQAPEFREWIVGFGDGGYVLRYRVERRSIYVLSVRHMKENR